MNWAFLRREWGAVAFVITVLIGIIVVPAALILKNPATAAPAVLVTPSPTPSPTASAPASPTTSPSRTPSPSASPSPRY
jgi:hypothetical protein